ncbi:MAG: hypothetical protein HOH13_03735 [Crocinitomicaceae bacterium]|nr:hypothetical protein [Crocinitomicaceae bacterium]MBT5404017.1 hypothetical protein [Crocinitomicaceae bacterium]MBT6029391.1 hypothetical protein [Crocinitomicaceae bacterium]MBT6514294.1 hypothetical protein [Crocinitomicaceae bacterium]
MTSLGKIAVICFVLAVVLVSCLKPQQFPPEPEISFKEFLIMSDSAKLTITFQDGDGDVGLNDADTLPPYDTSSIYHFNLFAQYWEKDDALGWVQGTDFLGNPIEFQYRTPIITPTGQNKALKGEIEMTLEPFYYNLGSSQSDTIMYKIMLVDRALNESNWAESTPIIR